MVSAPKKTPFPARSFGCAKRSRRACRSGSGNFAQDSYEQSRHAAEDGIVRDKKGTASAECACGMKGIRYSEAEGAQACGLLPERRGCRDQTHFLARKKGAKQTLENAVAFPQRLGQRL